MKYFILLFSMLFIIIVNVSAQNLIAVQNGGSPSFYTSLTTAVDSAVNGDTIYIPGGSFESISINKKLHLIGVGHHPDSTKITARTMIPSLNILSGADNGYVTGIFFPGTSLYSAAVSFNSVINGFTITRCNIRGLSVDAIGCSNISLSENIFGYYSLCLTCSNNYSIYKLNNASLLNNIFFNKIDCDSSQIKNNIFLHSKDMFSGSQKDLIENNVFMYYASGQTYNCIYRNNINGGTNTYDGNGNQGEGNINSIDINQVFKYYDYNTITTNNVYEADFHLATDSPYENSGRDGTDIGIYGGIFPWKEGSVPFNPHFQSARISPTTDSDGNLNVQIKVVAQDN